MRIRFLITSIVLFLFAGCGSEPRFDATSEETANASMKRLVDGLTEPEKKRFAGDLMTVSFPVVMKASFAKKGDVRPSTKPNDLFRSLDGMTRAEIHDRALEIRSTAKAKK